MPRFLNNAKVLEISALRSKWTNLFLCAYVWYETFFSRILDKICKLHCVHLVYILKCTDDGRVKANIIFWSYLGVVCFRAENHSCFCRKHKYSKPWGQGTHSAKMGAVVRPKIPQIPLKFSAQFVCPSPKVKNFRKKKFSGCP